MWFVDDGYVGGWWGSASWDAPSDGGMEAAAYRLMDGDDWAVNPPAPVKADKAEDMDAAARGNGAFLDLASDLLMAAARAEDYLATVRATVWTEAYSVVATVEGDMVRSDRRLYWEEGIPKGDQFVKVLKVPSRVSCIEYAGVFLGDHQVVVKVSMDEAEKVARRCLAACAKVTQRRVRV